MTRPVREVLLACAVWDASTDELARVRQASRASPDWTEWLWYVRWHRLVPHAERALQASHASAPQEVTDALRSEKLAIAARALAKTVQLGALLDALRDAGIPALPFKGPALSLAAYGDVGVRDSIDLDVVVRPRDVDAARDAIMRIGYVSRDRMSPAQEHMLQRSFGHFAYVRDGEPASVELHWRFASPRYPWSLRVDDVFARAGAGVPAGFPGMVPDAMDRLLLQAMHGARHQWERLEWLVAFHQLLRNSPVDEIELMERAAANRSDRALRVALRLSRDLLGAALPSRLGSAAGGAQIASLAAMIERSLEASDLSANGVYSMNLRAMDTAGDRVRYGALSALSPTIREWELVKLPDALLPLYYPIRLLRVLTLRLLALFVRR